MFLLAAAGGLATLAIYRCRSSRAGHLHPPTDHFDGNRFHNVRPIDHSALDLWRWQLTKEPGVWRNWVDAPPGPPPPTTVGDGFRVTFINHATVLVQIDGVNVLTDPIWSDRCSPVSWAGPRRHRPAGIRFDDLPPIDAVLLSHNHYDHLDLPTLRRLAARDRPLILAGLGNRPLLEKGGVDGEIIELDWWDSTRIGGVLSHFVPARHFSARGVCDRNRSLWGGWMLEGKGGRVYFAGDTGWDDHFDLIRGRIGPPDVALLPIGAFRPRWFMAPVHIGPDEAIAAHRALGASTTIPIHYGTFFLGDDGETEALDELRRALQETNLESEFAILEFGEAYAKGMA